MNSTTHQIPHLVPDLRLALATLYSLPSRGVQAQPSSHQAHDHLLQFQARNPRRTLHSKAGSQKQQQQQQQGQQQQQPTNDFANFGSTWLACVALVSSLSSRDPDPIIKEVHYTEALFAAQTLVHRLRRVKLAEAIDIEFEPTVFDPSSIASSPAGPEQILDGYKKWILHHYHGATALSSFGILSQIIQSYVPRVDTQNQPNLMELEERIKGEISMMIIVGIMDALTKASFVQTQQQADAFSKIRPLLKTLASILALIAARMRYVSTSLPSPAPNSSPIVSTILGVISMLQPQAHQQDPNQLQEAVQSLSFTCLTALPESVLTGSSSNGSGGGGAYGRFSLDPRCYAAVTAELKTQGISQMCLAIQNMINSSGNAVSPILILQMCEAWAKYVALPVDFVNSTIPLVLQAWEQLRSSRQTQPQALMEAKAAMAYWIAVMESGTWSIEQVLTSSLVQSKESSRQSNKKRTSSKSKKRHQQFLEEKTTNELFVSATKEVEQRGQVACTMAQQTLSVLQDLLVLELNRMSELKLLNDDSDQDFQGDGPVGAITACANACLPFLLRTSIAQQDAASMAMFTAISNLIQQVCASPSRLVRSFAAESLYTLHESLLKVMTDNQELTFTTEFLETIVNHFFKSALNLALQCGYPAGFFNDMSQENDEDLENERNDVRDVLRTISSISSTTATSVSLSLTSSSILLRLLQACAQPIREATASNSLFSEPALHAFSALAKPINSTAILYTKILHTGVYQDENIAMILKIALEIVSNAGRCLLQAFAVASINEVLPLTRLYDLAIASLAPMFSTLCQVESMMQEVERTIRIGIDVAASSLIKIPELTGPSTLRQSRFDIRGAMRSPGGEDHAGVLALMRLAKESGPLSMVFLKCKESMLVDLCELYESLKRIEDQRGIGVFYGVGVLPKSRRILLGVICHLVEANSSEKGEASRLLASMFENSVTSIASTSHQLENLQVDALSRICESTFDIAAFSPSMIRSLYDVSNGGSLQAGCLNVLHQVGNLGFLKALDPNIDFASIIGWNRVRAALFTLFKSAGSPDIPDCLVGILTSLIVSECEAATNQCSAGPTSVSRVFHEDVVSEESIPAGLFIRVLVETLENCLSMKIPMVNIVNVIQILYAARQPVIRTLLSECPNPVQKGSFYDPRPVLAETWFLCINRMAAIAAGEGLVSGQDTIAAEFVSVTKQLLVETFVAAISLLFYPSLEKTQQKRANDPGMCLDGPQGLVMMDFFQTFFDLGASMIQAGARELASVVPVNIENDPDTAGMAIIGAALFRGSQGGLPPWAVESVPSVYSALFKALNKNVDSFGHIFEISMNIRLLENRRFGSVEGGSLLSGRFFERMNDKAKMSFIEQAKDNARNDTTASWRRLKTLIKQACGGKKKDTDFKQRPALTSWDTLDRV